MNVLKLNLNEILNKKNLKCSKIKFFIISNKLFIFEINIFQKLLNLILLTGMMLCL